MPKCATLLLSKKLLLVLQRIPDRSEFIREGLRHGLRSGWVCEGRRSNGMSVDCRQTSYIQDDELVELLKPLAKNHLVSAFAQKALMRYIFLALEGNALAQAQDILGIHGVEELAMFEIEQAGY